MYLLPPLWLAIVDPCHASNDDAEVYKCVNGDEVVYQDTSCKGAQSNREIDRRYANEMSLAIPASELKEINRQLQQNAAARKLKIRERNDRIEKVIRRHKEKQATCTKAKEGYQKMLLVRRRHGYINGDEETKLLKRMREACSS